VRYAVRGSAAALGGEPEAADDGRENRERERGVIRPETRTADAGDSALLVDALANIDSYAAAIRPTDVPAATAAVHGCEAALLNTSKQVGAEATSGWEVRVCAELGACIAGSLDALRGRFFSRNIELHVGHLDLILPFC
jgi:trimethylamine:corrinoid methyltransferase-like protein